MEEKQTVDTVVDNSPSAENPPKKVRGRPITKETAKQYALSAAQAKKRRKEARLKMLDALTGQDVDLGAELKKALVSGDEVKIRCIREAIQMVGLHFDQSDEGREQRFNINAKTDNTHKLSGKIEFVVPPKG
jgi:hypothetical protein